MLLACLVRTCRAENISCGLELNSKSKLWRHLMNEGHTSQNLSTSVLTFFENYSTNTTLIFCLVWAENYSPNTTRNFCSCQRFWDILQKIHFHGLSVSTHYARIRGILSFTAVVIPVFLFHNKINWNSLGKRQHALIMSYLEVCGNSCKAKITMWPAR